MMDEETRKRKRNSPNHYMASSGSADIDGLKTLLFEQRREFMAAQTLESDLDLAFDLQMQEAIVASQALQHISQLSPLGSCSSPQLEPTQTDEGMHIAKFMIEEIDGLEQESIDREISEAEMRKMRDDLNRRIHDQKVASDILGIPEEEWGKYGDNFERPYSGGSLSTVTAVDESFRVYVTGLVSEERVRDSTVTVSAIGIAICDPKDYLIFELRKPLEKSFMSRAEVGIEALIEGLNAAIALDLKRVTCFVDDYMVHQYVMGKLPMIAQNLSSLVTKYSSLQLKFAKCTLSLVTRHDIKFSFKLARDAIVSQITWCSETDRGKHLVETCVICYEDTVLGKMFTVDGCLHRYCFSCMKQHVEVKLLNGMMAKCPHEGCRVEVNIHSCGKFLEPKLIEVMSQRMKEASIPVAEKVYCPYPKCSALMSKREVLAYTRDVYFGAEQSGTRKCMKCHRLFCINCQVPWHSSMSCHDFKRSKPCSSEDAKLKSLATKKLWRQCAKCKNMIELGEGCYHISCRCGYEFCYTCGAEWKNKKATCKCPLWDERNILYDNRHRRG